MLQPEWGLPQNVWILRMHSVPGATPGTTCILSTIYETGTIISPISQMVKLWLRDVR